MLGTSRGQLFEDEYDFRFNPGGAAGSTSDFPPTVEPIASTDKWFVNDLVSTYQQLRSEERPMPMVTNNMSFGSQADTSALLKHALSLPSRPMVNTSGVAPNPFGTASIGGMDATGNSPSDFGGGLTGVAMGPDAAAMATATALASGESNIADGVNTGRGGAPADGLGDDSGLGGDQGGAQTADSGGLGTDSSGGTAEGSTADGSGED